MTYRVELSELRGRRARIVESAEVVVDADDDEALVDLLRRMAKRNGIKAADAELRVRRRGFASRTIRV